MVRIKKIIFACGLFTLMIPCGVNGQEKVSKQINTKALYPTIAVPDSTAVEDENVQIPGKGVDNNLDSLLSIWYVQRSLVDTIGIVLLEGEDMPSASLHDSVYINRLNRISSVIELPYNDIIRNNIVYYTQRMPEKMEMILGLSEYYLPQFEEILDSHGVPLEFKILPIIESALNPLAVSRVGATGMWQFMLTTGREYKLIINSFVDERRDPIASAHAAAQYLNNMYKIFNDWTLALAAYNCGHGNVRKAIKRADGKTDFWDIYPYLPKETRNYVPAFIAATYAVNYHREHKLTPKTLALPTMIDTFMINQNLHFDQISEVVGMPIDELRDLNPQYKRDVIPGKERPYELRIPYEFTNTYIEKEREMYEYKDSLYFNPKTIANVLNSSRKNTSAQGRQKGLHQVQKGENASVIADKYGIKLSDLLYWNNLTSKSVIKPKQKLIVYSTKTKATTSSETSTSAVKTKGTTASTTTAEESATKSTTKEKTTEKSTPKAATSVKKPTQHTVKSGENLWSISQLYDDVNYYDLMKINGLNKNSIVKPGQKLKLK